MSSAERVRHLLPPGGVFRDVRWLDETDSTNRVVGDEARAGAPEGLVVVADYQTAGRGRLDRRWEAPSGSALLMSVLLRPLDLPMERRHLVTAAVALAAREAAGAVGAPLPDLKWPNDLLIGGRKLAGILAEASDTAVVVGIGCNVSWAPDGATCLAEEAGRAVERVELVAALLGALGGWLGRWDDVAAAYREHCATIGRSVRVESGGGTLEGQAVAVDEAGRLVVRSEKGVVAVSAGDVIHVRPGSGATWVDGGGPSH